MIEPIVRFTEAEAGGGSRAYLATSNLALTHLHWPPRLLENLCTSVRRELTLPGSLTGCSSPLVPEKKVTRPAFAHTYVTRKSRGRQTSVRKNIVGGACGG